MLWLSSHVWYGYLSMYAMVIFSWMLWLFVVFLFLHVYISLTYCVYFLQGIRDNIKKLLIESKYADSNIPSHLPSMLSSNQCSSSSML